MKLASNGQSVGCAGSYMVLYCVVQTGNMPREPRAVTDAKRTVLSTVQHATEGTWTITEWSNGRIELRRDDKNEMFQEIYEESMRLCRLRLALKASNRRLRDNVDRNVRFSCVESTWDWLSRTIPVDSKLVASLPVASCNLRDVLKLGFKIFVKNEDFTFQVKYNVKIS